MNTMNYNPIVKSKNKMDLISDQIQSSQCVHKILAIGLIIEWILIIIVEERKWCE